MLSALEKLANIVRTRLAVRPERFPRGQPVWEGEEVSACTDIMRAIWADALPTRCRTYRRMCLRA